MPVEAVPARRRRWILFRADIRMVPIDVLDGKRDAPVERHGEASEPQVEGLPGSMCELVSGETACSGDGHGNGGEHEHEVVPWRLIAKRDDVRSSQALDPCTRAQRVCRPGSRDPKQGQEHRERGRCRQVKRDVQQNRSSVILLVEVEWKEMVEESDPKYVAKTRKPQPDATEEHGKRDQEHDDR